MRIYETAFLLAPNLSEEDTEKLIQEMAEVIPAKKGKMINVDKWGKRKLAYQIKKFDTAHYIFFLYKGESDIPAELERRFKQNEAVIRYLTLKKKEGEAEITPPKKAASKPKKKEEAKPKPEKDLKSEKPKKTSKKQLEEEKSDEPV